MSLRGTLVDASWPGTWGNMTLIVDTIKYSTKENYFDQKKGKVLWIIINFFNMILLTDHVSDYIYIAACRCDKSTLLKSVVREEPECYVGGAWNWFRKFRAADLLCGVSMWHLKKIAAAIVTVPDIKVQKWQNYWFIISWLKFPFLWKINVFSTCRFS